MTIKLIRLAIAIAMLTGLLAATGCPQQEASAQAGNTVATAPQASAPAASDAAPSADVELATVTYSVEGMTCDHCVKGITGELAKVEGVKDCSADWEKGITMVSYDPAVVNDDAIIGKINALGYTASLPEKANLEMLAGGGCGSGCGGCGEKPAMAEKSGCEGCPDKANCEGCPDKADCADCPEGCDGNCEDCPNKGECDGNCEGCPGKDGAKGTGSAAEEEASQA